MEPVVFACSRGAVKPTAKVRKPARKEIVLCHVRDDMTDAIMVFEGPKAEELAKHNALRIMNNISGQGFESIEEYERIKDEDVVNLNQLEYSIIHTTLYSADYLKKLRLYNESQPAK